MRGPHSSVGREAPFLALVCSDDGRAKLDIYPDTLSKWTRLHERAHAPTVSELSNGGENLATGERQNCELRKANEILRKASAYFAQPELDHRVPSMNGSSFFLIPEQTVPLRKSPVYKMGVKEIYI